MGRNQGNCFPAHSLYTCERKKILACYLKFFFYVNRDRRKNKNEKSNEGKKEKKTLGILTLVKAFDDVCLIIFGMDAANSSC